jgi:hypothetical protein
MLVWTNIKRKKKQGRLPGPDYFFLYSQKLFIAANAEFTYFS